MNVRSNHIRKMTRNAFVKFMNWSVTPHIHMDTYLHWFLRLAVTAVLCVPVLTCMGLYGPVLACMKLCGPVWACMDLYETVWTCIGLYGPV
jgi:hypothetical protein